MLSEQDFRQLLGEHVTDDRAERALREDRKEWEELQRLRQLEVDARVWKLEDELMEMRVKYES